MSMTARTLVNVTITDVSDKLPIYCACPECYAKLVEESFYCPKCHRQVACDKTTYRYCLVVEVTDASTSADVTVFGSSLNTLLGATPKQIQMLLEKRQDLRSSEIWLDTLRGCLIGRKVILGIKTHKSSMNPNITLSKILTSLVNKNENLVATQIFPISKDCTTYYEALEMKISNQLISSPDAGQINNVVLKSCERVTRRSHFLLPSSGHYSAISSAATSRDSSLISSLDSVASCKSRGYGVEHLSSDLSELSCNFTDLTLEPRTQSPALTSSSMTAQKVDLTPRKALDYKDSGESSVQENALDEATSDSMCGETPPKSASRLLNLPYRGLTEHSRDLTRTAVENTDNDPNSGSAVIPDADLDSSSCSDDSDICLLRFVCNAEGYTTEGPRESLGRKPAEADIVDQKPAEADLVDQKPNFHDRREEPEIIDSNRMTSEANVTEITVSSSGEASDEQSQSSVKTVIFVSDRNKQLSNSNFHENEITKQSSHSCTIPDEGPSSQDYDLAGISFSSWDGDESQSVNTDQHRQETETLEEVPDSENMWEFLDKCDENNSERCEVVELLNEDSENTQDRNTDVSTTERLVTNCITPSSTNVPPSAGVSAADCDNSEGRALHRVNSCDVAGAARTLSESIISDSFSDNSHELFDGSMELFDSNHETDIDTDTPKVYRQNFRNQFSEELFSQCEEYSLQENPGKSENDFGSQSLFSQAEDFNDSVLNTSTPVSIDTRAAKAVKSRIINTPISQCSLRRNAIQNCMEGKLKMCFNDDSCGNYSGDMFE